MARAINMTMTSRRRFPARTIFRRRWADRHYYDPPERGFEREIKKRLDYWAKLRTERG